MRAEKLTSDESNELLGDIDFKDTSGITVPESLIDQVIGQEEAVEVIKKAARQRRHVMLIGSPGTGKSMLGKAMSELLPVEELQDVMWDSLLCSNVLAMVSDIATPAVKDESPHPRTSRADCKITKMEAAHTKYAKK